MFKEGSNKSEGKSKNLVPANTPRKLTAHDVAFGIGRKATDEELEEYLSRPVGKFKSAKKVLKEIKEQLKARREKRKAS